MVVHGVQRADIDGVWNMPTVKLMRKPTVDDYQIVVGTPVLTIEDTGKRRARDPTQAVILGLEGGQCLTVLCNLLRGEWGRQLACRMAMIELRCPLLGYHERWC